MAVGKLDGAACATITEGTTASDVRRSRNFQIFRNEVADSSSGANAQPGKPLRRPNSAPSPGRGAELWKVGPVDKAQSKMNKMNAEGDGEVGYTVDGNGLVTADGD